MRFVKPSATLIVALALWVMGGPAALAQSKQTPAPKATQAPKATPPAKQAAAPAKAPAKVATRVETALAAAPVAKRDPFLPLIAKGDTGKGVPENLPPGPAGLVVSTLRVDGIVRAPSGMIAVVSNPQQRVYFLREGAKLYDGTVERIAMDGVTFRERGKDPFGKPLDRQVVKRLYPRAGEQ